MYLYPAAAALVATFLPESQELMSRSSTACKSFGLTISIKKSEVVDPLKLMPMSTRFVPQTSSAYTLPSVPITVDDKEFKHSKSFKYLDSKNQQFNLS